MELLLIALLAGGGVFLYMHEPMPVELKPRANDIVLVRKFDPKPTNLLQDSSVLSGDFKDFEPRIQSEECKQRMNGDITGDWLDYNFATKDRALDWYEHTARNSASGNARVNHVVYEFSVETERGFIWFGYECP